MTFLRDARRAGTARGASKQSGVSDESPRQDVEPGSGMRDHPSVRRPARSSVGELSRAFDLDDQKSGEPASRSASPAEKSAGGDRSSKRASNVSIHQLARRGMSRWELEQVLARREIEPETAQAELDRLESVGLLDDAALAVTLVYTQHTRKGLGRSAIEQELKRRHIDPVIIEDALEEIADDDELERATELAMKRVGQLASYDDETAKRRLHGFLARKGYDSSTVRQAMDVALATRGKRGVRFE
ncbi:regulatory protein RecX [Leifsonia sp. NPDC058230]|uniref:regulatory protein RecX n=1 Tax=Leifsonia sp. NPDC058230 TaxID=3346391 RepID=UPI0036DBD817